MAAVIGGRRAYLGTRPPPAAVCGPGWVWAPASRLRPFA